MIETNDVWAYVDGMDLPASQEDRNALSRIRTAHDTFVGACAAYDKTARKFAKADAEMMSLAVEVLGFRVLKEATPDRLALRHAVAYKALCQAKHFRDLRLQEREAAFDDLREAILEYRGHGGVL